MKKEALNEVLVAKEITQQEYLFGLQQTEQEWTRRFEICIEHLRKVTRQRLLLEQVLYDGMLVKFYESDGQYTMKIKPKEPAGFKND